MSARQPAIWCVHAVVAVAVASCSGAQAHEGASALEDPHSQDEELPADEAAGHHECGMSPDDWCPAPEGDPCGALHEVQACQADTRCEGMPYRGESLVACALVARCFAHNCRSVGCVSRCETLGEQACEMHGYRCTWNGATCERATRCGS